MTGPREAPVPDVVDTMLDMLAVCGGIADIQERHLRQAADAGCVSHRVLACGALAAYRELCTEFLALGMPVTGFAPGADPGLDETIRDLRAGHRTAARERLMLVMVGRGARPVLPQAAVAQLAARFADQLADLPHAVLCWSRYDHGAVKVTAVAHVPVPNGAPAMLLRATGATYAEACADLEAQLARHRTRPVLPIAIVAEPAGASA